MRIQTVDEMIVKNRLIQVGSKFKATKRGEYFAVFVCSCGNRKVIGLRHVEGGSTVSCGCSAAEHSRKARRTHGDIQGGKKSAEYKAWSDMKARCLRSTHPRYSDYGGRGITVCERWLRFEHFLNDMGRMPTATTLDRRENGLGYCKENCRWATRTQQQRNTRVNRIVELNGVKMTMVEAAVTHGINYDLLRSRLNLGWSVEKALRTPKRGESGKPHILE